MSLAVCSIKVDGYGKEKANHGDSWFPVAFYYDDLEKKDRIWHWHDELEVELVLEGEAHFTIGGEKRLIRAGEGVFVSAKKFHDCGEFASSGCCLCTVVFHPELIAGKEDSVFYQKYLRPFVEDPQIDGVFFSPDIPWQKEALSCIEKAWQSGVQEGMGYEFEVRYQLSLLMVLLERECVGQKSPQLAQSCRNGERMKRMVHFINEHIEENLTVRSIAKSAAISESECLRCFRATIRTTPIQFVRQCRIRKSADLLITTDEKISNIARMCGFDDLSYFTKTFREMKGKTPSEYRRHHLVQLDGR